MQIDAEKLIGKLVIFFGIVFPVCPILLFLFFYYLPVSIEPYVIDLGGTWKAQTSCVTTNVVLPGLFPNYGISSFDISVERKVVLKDTMVGEDLFLTVFGTIFQTGRVYVNGHLIGEIGSYLKHRKLGNIQGMDGFFIQKEDLLRTNEIKLLLQTEDLQSFGIQDPRFYIGISGMLKPYYEKNLIVNNIFLYGVPFFSLFMLILMTILSIAGWNSGYRDKYIATANYILFTLLFNLFFSGIFISYFLPLDFLMVGLDAVIVLFVLANMEFVQYYYLNKINKIGVFNRMVCFLAFSSYVLNYIVNRNSNEVVNIIYDVFSVYIMFSFGYSLYVVVKSVFKSRTGYGTIISFSILMTIITGVSDLLSNFGIIRFPLVFSVTASSVSIIATIVVIADFIDIGNRNLKLSKFLRKSNENLRNLIRELRKKKLMEYDMFMASKIQTALLPQKFPDNERVSISGGSIPARLVGGDYFDVIPIGESRFLCAIADVMGKGMSASLVMVKVQTLLRALSGEDLSLIEIADRINGIIAGEFKGERFVTLSLLLYDCGEKKADYVIYGHEPILIRRAKDESVEAVKNNNVPLGINEKIDKTENPPIILQSGDRVVLFTDGVTDAQDEKERFFGMEKLKQILRSHVNEGKRGLFTEVIRNIDLFRGTMEQTDDITMLILDVK